MLYVLSLTCASHSDSQVGIISPFWHMRKLGPETKKLAEVMQLVGWRTGSTWSGAEHFILYCVTEIPGSSRNQRLGTR